MQVAPRFRQTAMENGGRKITLLDLLSELQAEGAHSEQALVSLVLGLISSGRVVLCGNYSGARMRPAGSDRRTTS